MTEKKSAGHKQNGPQATKNTDEQDRAVAPSPHPERSNEECEERYCKPEKEPRYKKILNISGFAVSALTLIAAGLAAFFAGSLVTATHDLEKHQLRAYVFTTPNITTAQVANVSGALSLEINWKNSGVTQTRNLTIYTSSSALGALTKNFRFPALGRDRKPIANPTPINSVLGPGTEMPTMNVIIDPKAVDAIVAAHGGFYIWGWARYGDVFDPKARHLTRFCREITAFVKNPSGNLVGAVSRDCDFGNCAEDECIEQNLP